MLGVGLWVTCRSFSPCSWQLSRAVTSLRLFSETGKSEQKLPSLISKPSPTLVLAGAQVKQIFKVRI